MTFVIMLQGPHTGKYLNVRSTDATAGIADGWCKAASGGYPWRSDPYSVKIKPAPSYDAWVAAGSPTDPAARGVLLSANAVDDNSPPATVIGALSVEGYGAGPWTYSLTDTAGGQFAVAGSNVVVGLTALDHDLAPSPTIAVRATNGTIVINRTFVMNVRNPLPALPLPNGARLMLVGDSQEGFHHGQTNQMGTDTVKAAWNYQFGPLVWLRAVDARFNMDNWYDPADPWHRSKTQLDGSGPGIQGSDQGIFGDHLDWNNANYGNGILNRLDYALSKRPQMIVLQGGTNTLNSGDDFTNSTTVAATQKAEYAISKWELMLQKCRNAGVPVVLRVVLPRGGGAADWPLGDPRIAELLKLRDWQRAQAGRDGVVALWDDWDILTDANGQWLPDYSSDKVHLNTKGAKVTGAAAGATKIKTIIETNIGAGSLFNQDPTISNLLGASMGNMAGTTGQRVGAGTTGLVATGFSLRMNRGASTQVASKETISGSLTRQAIAITPVNDGIAYHWSDFYMTAAVAAGIPAEGSWLRAYLFVEVPASVGAKLGMINFFASARQLTNNIAQAYAHQANSGTYLEDNWNGDGCWLMTEPFQIPTGQSYDGIFLYARAAFAMDSAPFTIKYSRPIIRSTADPRPPWGF